MKTPVVNPNTSEDVAGPLAAGGAPSRAPALHTATVGLRRAPRPAPPAAAGAVTVPASRKRGALE
ncbi:hypothetical protein [Sinomonas sp.]|uniref:hypothetical protein n=1 Tax=Sinomonas sp. TaxID=1914986 RepID=UPI002FDFBE22